MTKPLKISLISLHGLIRSHQPELGRDADTGGQVKYVLELAAELGRNENVESVELLTRQILDNRIGPDYAKLEEAISDNVKIVRIPFGPRRYLRKEALWPFIDGFIDQTLSHFKRCGLPDLIHGHYADAGLGGAQLARLLGIPYVFTGHSLGRVKRERLLESGATEADLEKKYKLITRIEAEEMALETSSMVVASTAQEVHQQYEIYEDYKPDQMEVIPPGVDLTSFHPPDESTTTAPICEALVPFLRDPEKPIILTIARPDERKNLEMLVRVYGESQKLQELANLVLILGTRDDLRELAAGQRRVVLNVLSLIDVYDLYSKVAYPKTHNPTDIPDLYRLAAARRGVFINPAFTEPFGLTLLEAAASGLPIVAPNDGGPRDIIANCQNGLLIDPLDAESIEKALLRGLTEPEQWDEWSRNGEQGVNEHYSWNKHVRRYMRDVADIFDSSAEPALAGNPRGRAMTEFDRMIITDLDNTLTGDDEALRELADIINENDHIGFGISTGRGLRDAIEKIEELNLPVPDLIDAAVGTELYYGKNLTVDRTWMKQIAFQWNPDRIHEVLDDIEGLFPQQEQEQSRFKISYKIDPKIAPTITQIKRRLREAGVRAKVVLSLGIYLDVVPVRAGSDSSIRHLAYKWGFTPEQLLVAGDSGNDAGVLKGRTLGVVVGNYSPELEKLRKLPRIYFAQGKHARGIIEGIEYYQFLNHIIIPNDRVEPEHPVE